MIDTDKYEGLNEAIDRIINSDEIGIDDLLADSMSVKDAINELLAEVKRLHERIDEFGIAVRDMLPMWNPGDYDEVEINGERKIMVDEDWWRWMATHIETLLYPIRYHVEGKRYNHDTCEWEEKE